MADFTSDDVVNKLRALKLSYIQNKVGADPAKLPEHFSEFLGYATLLYDHYATALRQYRKREAEVIREEHEAREKHNATAERGDKVTVTEVEQRVTFRLSTLKARRDFLEVEVKGATLHINGCQSLMKTWGDEAKGVR
ncbi:hypothetical protein KC963_02265 [Candidatus Saccharibacteria bacterium]|nr:hypothetical protein [Candidatus Saccharibacteria bacterium]